jgi:hypothetical protein
MPGVTTRTPAFELDRIEALPLEIAGERFDPRLIFAFVANEDVELCGAARHFPTP